MIIQHDGEGVKIGDIKILGGYQAWHLDEEWGCDFYKWCRRKCKGEG